MSLLRYATFLLDEKREEINFKALNSMKVARQTAIKCIAQVCVVFMMGLSTCGDCLALCEGHILAATFYI